MIYVLFNPKSNNSRGEADAKEWGKCLKGDVKYLGVIGLDFKKFFDGLKKDDEVILAGGDGTVNRFANDTYGYNFKNKLFYIKAGSGNDFYHDVQDKADENGLVDLRPYLKNLPLVEANGIKRRFLNGAAFGLDGQCCEVGDEIRVKDPSAVINYSGIAIKLLLGKYKLRKATVEVDGKTYEFKHVWLASTMHGHYYGGGMNAAPEQDRLNKENLNDLVVLSSVGRIHTLLRFPKFSAGKHKKAKFIHHFIGKKITVTFDIPCALQIDGDVIKNVKTYTVTNN